jgi:type II secretory pathway predicted ATPase ExeA
MYLEHFGLNEPPFRITPVTVFFFSGANRGEILDALIYSLNEAEGIIKVSGEVGSGKTMLCRMLLERLPEHVETIYLANPSLSREEMLYAIADALDLHVDNKRVGIIMHSIQNKLEEKAREGKRIVVLVDEAHAMPLDTLEELRLLYNLQIGNSKLLQIVLFGQPELNAKLEQPNMRQLKDRIVHHFHMQPLSRNVLESYLMFRMRAAGYRGPDIFTPEAVKLIAQASNGLMRRINILADKSLLAAFVEDTHKIEARHVQAAMRDSEIKPARPLPDKRMLTGGAVAALLLAGLASWLMADSQPKTSTTPLAQPDNAPAVAGNAVQGNIATARLETTTVATPPPPPAGATLFEQRLAAGRQLLDQKSAIASIQLFYQEDIQPARIEGFLERARELGKFSEIYLLPTRFGNKDGVRVVYGIYPSADAARAATKDLPQRYQDAFTTSIHTYAY